MPVAGNIYYHFHEKSSPVYKPAVVLIHGAGGSHLYWPAEIRRLPGYQVYAPDLPGHGKSEGRGRQRISDYAEVLVEWLAEVDVYSAIFIGHSMGSAIGISLALGFPEHVSGLVLVGGGARLKVAKQLLDYLESPSTYLTAVKILVERSFSESAPRRLKELAEKRMAETRLSVLYNDLKACDEFDETSRMNQINRPTMIICGRDDQMTPLRYSEFLAEQIPGAGLKVFSEAGHMVQLENPIGVADCIRDFLNGIR